MAQKTKAKKKTKKKVNKKLIISKFMGTVIKIFKNVK